MDEAGRPPVLRSFFELQSSTYDAVLSDGILILQNCAYDEIMPVTGLHDNDDLGSRMGSVWIEDRLFELPSRLSGAQ